MSMNLIRFIKNNQRRALRSVIVEVLRYRGVAVAAAILTMPVKTSN